MDSNRYPVPHPQVGARVVDSEAVIILADSGNVNVLNPVGTRIWELADGSRSVQQIADALVAEYEVTTEVALQDVTEFLRKLVDAGMLTLQDVPSSVGASGY
jgi:hypothetical protein